MQQSNVTVYEVFKCVLLCHNEGKTKNKMKYKNYRGKWSSHIDNRFATHICHDNLFVVFFLFDFANYQFCAVLLLLFFFRMDNLHFHCQFICCLKSAINRLASVWVRECMCVWVCDVQTLSSNYSIKYVECVFTFVITLKIRALAQ